MSRLPIWISSVKSKRNPTTVTPTRPTTLRPILVAGNMRRQSEKMSREQTLYRKRSDNWIGWEGAACAQNMPPAFPHLISFPSLSIADCQRTRCNVVTAYNQAPVAMRPALLRDVLIIMFHSVTPPGA
jgi:hypothetical protein